MRNLIAFCVFVLLLAGCKNSGNNAAPKSHAEENASVDAKTFRTLIDQNGAELIDVRTAGEYAEGHLPGAVNFDWQSPEFESLVTNLDKNKPVYVYCQRGGRSAEAAEAMRKAGFKNVMELSGGMIAWKKEGYALEDAAKEKPATGLTATAFNELLHTDKYVLVDFNAKWCGPCKKITPMVRQLAAENPNIKLVEIDVDENADLANGMGISAIPLLHIYKDQKLIWKNTGLISKEKLKAAFN